MGIKCAPREWLLPECRCGREECQCPGGTIQLVKPSGLAMARPPALVVLDEEDDSS